MAAAGEIQGRAQGQGLRTKESRPDPGLAESQDSHQFQHPWTLKPIVPGARHVEYDGNDSSEEYSKASQDRVQGSHDPRVPFSQAGCPQQVLRESFPCLPLWVARVRKSNC